MRAGSNGPALAAQIVSGAFDRYLLEKIAALEL